MIYVYELRLDQPWAKAIRGSANIEAIYFTRTISRVGNPIEKGLGFF